MSILLTAALISAPAHKTQAADDLGSLSCRALFVQGSPALAGAQNFTSATFANWTEVKQRAQQVFTLEQLLTFAHELVSSRVPARTALLAMRLTPFVSENNPRLIVLTHALDDAANARGISLELGDRADFQSEALSIDQVLVVRDNLAFHQLAIALAETEGPEATQVFVLSQTPLAKQIPLSQVQLENIVRSYQREHLAVKNWLKALQDFRSQGRDPRPNQAQRRIDPTQVLANELSNKLLLRLLQGQDEKSDLYLKWKINNPDGLFKLTDGGYEVRALSDPSVVYRGDPNNLTSPLLRVREFMSSPNPQADFYPSVYKNYETRIRDEIVRLVERVETELPAERQSWGEVLSLGNREITGTVRIFDGTVLREEDLFSGEKPVSQADDQLVFERIFAARGIDIQWKKVLQQIKAKHPFQKIFEIGKFSLAKDAPPEIHERSLKILELFLLDHYLTKYPDAIFFAHTASEAHRVLYMRRYGFKVVEEVKIPGTNTTEHILVVSAKKLRAIIEARLKLNRPS